MEKVVISLGGSIINPGTLNVQFLKQFTKIIRKQKGKQIIICTGGGKLARDYMAPLKSQGKIIEDIAGIEATQLNALLLALLLKTQKTIPRNYKELKPLLKKRILVCGGFPEDLGTTSDGTAAEVAKMIHAKTLINITNVSGLYDKDPKKNKNAKLISKITHEKFWEMIRKHHEKPGQHFVLDKHAAKVCQENNITIYILKGKKNLEHALNKKKFLGTIISS
ncbi:UMP kinase [Candidatus Woesearchaeota archaeon]|nr:UMP kinase [Candidatus Woesearchaeota archaeon]